MRANGYNAVSLYFFWGLHQSKEGGPFDFSKGTIKDLDLLLTMAQEEGLYVIARPGPYVNAEISMGGLPAWMTNYSGGLRTTTPRCWQPPKPGCTPLTRLPPSTWSLRAAAQCCSTRWKTSCSATTPRARFP